MIEFLTGGLIALAGAWLTHHFALKRKKLEDRRWYAEYFLGRKLEALSNLYAALNDCHDTLIHFGNCLPLTVKEFKENVTAKEEAYKRAKVTASIFLNEDQDKIMARALGAFRQASLAIFLNLPDEELLTIKKSSYPSQVKVVDWSKLDDAYKGAKDCMRQVLNPELLSKIENLDG